jgi:hypothetical protein
MLSVPSSLVRNSTSASRVALAVGTRSNRHSR